MSFDFHVHLLINTNAETNKYSCQNYTPLSIQTQDLARDTKVQQKSTKALCKTYTNTHQKQKTD